MDKKILLDSPIVEINSTDDPNIREITMLIHKCDIPNGNGLDFKEEYTKQYMSTLIDKPVVTAYYPIKDDLGDHEAIYDENGYIVELRTIAIGTVKEAWIADYTLRDQETVKALFAKAVVWSYKYPQIVSCIERLHSEGKSTSSVEVEVYEYLANPTRKYRAPVNYSYLGNCLLGSTVAPADSDAGVINLSQYHKEVAVAVANDLKSQQEQDADALKGGENVSEKIVFNKGFKVKYFGNPEQSDLSYDDIRDQIYNAINPLNPENESREYHFWIRELFQTYVILEDWDTNSVMYKATYNTVNNTVSLQSRDQWVQVEVTYQPVGININQLLADKQQEVTELNNQHKEVENRMEEQVKELEGKVSELSNKVQELEGTIVSQAEAIKTHEAREAELNTQVAEMSTFKEKYETSEKEAKAKQLSEKYGKVLNTEVFSSDRVQNAIKENNENELNSIVAEEVLKEFAARQPENKPADVVVNARQSEDLIPQDRRAKLYAPKSE